MDGRSTHGRIARWPQLLAACALALLVAVGAGCGGGSSSSTKSSAKPKHAVDPAVQARLMASGQHVFEQHCHTCHTLLGKRHTGPVIEVPAPNFDDVKPSLAYVMRREEVGGFDMQSFKGQLSDAQMRAVATYVSTVAGTNVRDRADSGPQGAELAAGMTVFQANCQRCHQLAGRAATGKPAYPGTNFDDVRVSEGLVVRQALRGIQEEMPSFRGKLSRAQLDALASYVASASGKGG